MIRVCDLTTPLGRLARAMKHVREHWGDTKSHWADQVANDFEERHIAPLLTTITQAAASIQRFQEILNQAEKECSEEHET